MRDQEFNPKVAYITADVRWVIKCVPKKYPDLWKLKKTILLLVITMTIFDR